MVQTVNRYNFNQTRLCTVTTLQNVESLVLNLWHSCSCFHSHSRANRILILILLLILIIFLQEWCLEVLPLLSAVQQKSLLCVSPMIALYLLRWEGIIKESLMPSKEYWRKKVTPRNAFTHTHLHLLLPPPPRIYTYIHTRTPYQTFIDFKFVQIISDLPSITESKCDTRC